MNGAAIEATDERVEALAGAVPVSGFDRHDSTTMGTLQFCYTAASGEVHQVDKDGVYSLLTAQTTFADGTTAIADRTLAVYKSAGEANFSYWYGSTLVEVSEIKTIQMANTGGGYTYFNAAGDLEEGSDVADAIITQTLVAFILWNTTENELFYMADERHGIGMSPDTHRYLHGTLGFAWGDGGDITGLVDNGTTFTAVTAGRFYDEDIVYFPAEAATAPFAYREGAEGLWRVTAADSSLGFVSGGASQWNNPDAGGPGVWGLTPISGGAQYQIMTFWQTNNKLTPLIQILGQEIFTSRNDARDQLPYWAYKLEMDGFPASETTLLGSMIIHEQAAGQIETGADGEIWVDHRHGPPVSIF